jgi:hypothetical protein
LSVESVERLADSEARRAKLDRVIERFQRDDAARRYKALDVEITRLFEAGLDIPPALRAEHIALASTLKKG